MKTTKVIITVTGGIVQSVHSNTPIHYIVLDSDMGDDHEPEISREDTNISDFIDILDSDKNKSVLDNLVKSNEDFNEIEYAKEILAKNGYVKHFWHVDDINHQANQDEVELTDDEVNKVIGMLENIDCNEGINWDTISVAINEVKTRENY